MKQRWNEVRASTWANLRDALEEVLDAYRDPPTYLFRGQADSAWSLQPSLARRLRHVQDRRGEHNIESYLEAQFKAQSTLFPETRNVSQVLLAAPRTEAWAFMQHHGCATRLLDWTASAYVGAYFAVHELPDRPGALFVVAPEALRLYAEQQAVPYSLSDEHLVDLSGPERVAFTYPALGSSRLVAQQGHFSMGTNVLASHDDAILTACTTVAAHDPSRIICRKIVIDADLKLVVLQQLRAMNVAPHALFPGLDGLGRSLSDLASLRAILDREPMV